MTSSLDGIIGFGGCLKLSRRFVQFLALLRNRAKDIFAFFLIRDVTATSLIPFISNSLKVLILSFLSI